MRERRSGGGIAGDDTPYFRYKSQQFHSRLLSRVPVEGRTILDVGCGAGGPLSVMARRQPQRLAGCDITPDMVELARENVPSAEIVQIDGASLPFSDRDFDVVTTVTVLQHNPDELCSQLLGEICRVAGQEVFLFEDTTQRMQSESGQGQYANYWGRTTDWYAGETAKRGFDLAETLALRTKVSRRVFATLSARLDRNRRGKDAEGVAFSRLHLAIESATLPVTRLLDQWITDPNLELTMMRFQRNAQ